MSGTATQPMWRAEVIVMPKDGVNDPEGEAILGGLHSLGYTDVSQVRAGRVLHVDLSAPNEGEARASISRMCDQMLANPVIESYQIAVEPVEAVAGART